VWNGEMYQSNEMIEHSRDLKEKKQIYLCGRITAAICQSAQWMRRSGLEGRCVYIRKTAHHSYNRTIFFSSPFFLAFLADTNLVNVTIFMSVLTA
jgi:hypothetical protein